MIDPIGQSTYAATTMPTPATTPDESSVAPGTTITDEPEISPAVQDETVGAVEDQNGGSKAKGVLRLLQAGHFHGVADVRLRINFHEEIAAMEREQYAQTAQQGLTDLQAVVGDQMTTLLENSDLEESTTIAMGDALAAFDAALTQHASDTPDDAATLTDQIRADFDNLVSSLKTALGVDAESDPDAPTDEITNPEDIPESTPQMAAIAADEPPASTPDTAPAADYQSFIDDLISAFETKMQELQASLTDINVLPELSAPHGNGKAYDKFVAMYNDMRTPPSVTTPEPGVDTNA